MSQNWQQLYDELIEQSPDLVITVRGGKITTINPAGLRSLGASGPEDVIGKPLSDLSADPIADASDMIAVAQPPSGQVEWVKLDGTKIDLEISTTPVVLEGRIELRIVGRDMTLLRKTEQMLRESQSHHRRLSELYLDLIGVESARTSELHAALRRARQVDELKSQLLSTVSHELRTPLTAIRGQTSTLLDYADEVSPAERLEALHIIDKEAARLDELIGHILDMSRIESGALRVEPIAMDLSPILRETIALFAAQAPRHNLHANLPPGLPLVQADPRRVRQVLCNLLDNAVKFSPAGSTIMVNTQNTPTVLLVSVKDEGAGIAPEHLPRLFDRFYRVESRGLRTGGVGLGLAISKGLVEAMGGQVSVASQPGEGSVFSFSLLLTSGVLEHVKEKWATHSSN